ncbi:MAG: hypothetical protein Hals2KO_07770 [Halioglobus sp.]
MAYLEHVNLTVSDPRATAELLCELFEWHIRWEGPSQMGGDTVHVGTDTDYIAVYTLDGEPPGSGRTGKYKGGLNHVGVVVDDLVAVESRVIAAGLEPFNHMNYEPGRRFYFLDRDGIEFEVVSYA